MKVEEYIKGRLEHQIGWYDYKSQKAQRNYKKGRIVECVLAATIPFLAGITIANDFYIKIIIWGKLNMCSSYLNDSVSCVMLYYIIMDAQKIY